jgi:hypothetical protein
VSRIHVSLSTILPEIQCSVYMLTLLGKRKTLFQSQDYCKALPIAFCTSTRKAKMRLLLLTSVERFVYVSNQIENDKGPWKKR